MTHSRIHKFTTKALTAAGLTLALQGIGTQISLADAQDDARALLDHGGIVSAPTIKGSSDRLTRIPDAQEQARRLLAKSSGGIVVTGEPVVMRLDKDEFRIAFGVEDQGASIGARNGAVHYRIDWKATDGSAHSDVRQVNYTIPADVTRTIAVDRQYLDTAEGQNSVDIIKVSVAAVSRE